MMGMTTVTLVRDEIISVPMAIIRSYLNEASALNPGVTGRAEKLVGVMIVKK
jgi:hypothetical protein